CLAKMDMKLLAVFTVICLSGIYTHFYGAVSSCAFFLAQGIAFLGRSRTRTNHRRLRGYGYWIITTDTDCIRGGPITTFSPHDSFRSYSGRPESDRSVFDLFVEIGRRFCQHGLYLGINTVFFVAQSIATVRRVRDRHLRPFDWLMAVVVFVFSQ